MNSSLFQSPTKAEWTAKASQDLKTEDLNGLLEWEPFNKIKMGAYFDQSDRSNSIPLTNYFASLTYANWLLYDHISGNDAGPMNLLALKGLKNGATGVLFQTDDLALEINSTLWKDILPQHCGIAFTGNKADQYADQFITAHPTITDQITGFVINGKKLIKTNSGFKSLGISLKNNWDMIPTLVNYLQTLTQYHKIYGEVFIQHLNVRVILNNLFYQNIAVIRAIRWLSQLYMTANNLPGSAMDIHLHAFIAPAKDYKEGLLKNANSGVAAILGGAQSIHFELQSPKSSDFNQRIARNVGNLMRDESKLTFDKDPVAGSYFIDTLTNTLAENAWTQYVAAS